MTRSYRHLTFEDRCQVKIPKKSGLSKGSIAQHPTGNGGLITILGKFENGSPIW